MIRGAGTFKGVLPTFVLVSRIHLAQQYRDDDHFLSASSSSQHETMVDGALSRASAVSTWVSVGLPSCLDREVAHRIRGFLVCGPHLYL